MLPHIFFCVLGDFKKLVTYVLRKESTAWKLRCLDVHGSQYINWSEQGFESRRQQTYRAQTLISQASQATDSLCRNTRAATEDPGRNVHGCAPEELYLQKQAAGHGLPTASGEGKNWKERLAPPAPG